MNAEHPKILRVYDTARTATFEFMTELTDSRLIYRKRAYDFDEAAAVRVHAQRRSTLQAIREIASTPWDIVELNEPTMFLMWHRWIFYRLAAAFSAIRFRKRPTIVVYAIDNLDVPRALASRAPRLLRPVAFFVGLSVLRALTSSVDRIAYGTPDAQHAYSNYLSHHRRRPETKMIPQLPAACSCDMVAKENLILFLGSFESRKGFPELLAGWDQADVPEDWRLHLVGKGPLEDSARAYAEARRAVRSDIDPPRERIHVLLRRARIVVLPSKPTSTWREQVGLPILEGIAHGCVVITSSDTGLASWLKQAGHTVIDTVSAQTVATAITDCVRNPPPSNSMSLPAVHGRVSADRWLCQGG